MVFLSARADSPFNPRDGDGPRGAAASAAAILATFFWNAGACVSGGPLAPYPGLLFGVVAAALAAVIASLIVETERDIGSRTGVLP
jgi:hypothetical protein